MRDPQDAAARVTLAWRAGAGCHDRRMTRRGSDDRGTYAEPGVALGVRRLSIVGVKGGHQPVMSEGGHVVAVRNGELYNHVDLRRELRADEHVFAGRCDTEILALHGSDPAYCEFLDRSAVTQLLGADYRRRRTGTRLESCSRSCCLTPGSQHSHLRSTTQARDSGREVGSA